MFNDEQRGHMRYLDTLPMTDRCWCGWQRLGNCFNAGCKSGRTRQDFLNAACPECFTLPPVHRLGCSEPVR